VAVVAIRPSRERGTPAPAARREPAGNALERRTPTPLDPATQVHRADLPTPPTVRLRPTVVDGRGWLLLRNTLQLAWRMLLVVARHGRDPVRMGGLVTRFAVETGGLWGSLPGFFADHRFAFSAAFSQVLLEARGRSDGFPFDDVRRIVEQDLGRPVEEVFERFDPNPMAATVSAQTHKAKLAAEQVMVAVKVQRPGFVEVMRADLRIAKRLRPLLVWLTGIPRTHWDDGLWRIESGLAQELDYRLEATHMRRLGRRLRKHKVIVPRVYPEYSGRRTLTKDFVTGVTVAEFVRTRRENPRRVEEWLRENDVSATRVGRRVFESLMRQILEEDLFDRDWNPYNTLILKGSRVAIVDFWAMVSIERAFQAKLTTLLRAIAEREFRKAADYFILIGPPVPPTHDAGEVRRQIIHALRTFDVRARARMLAYEEKALTHALGEIGRVLAADGSPPTFDFLEVERALRVVDLSLKELLPHENVMKMHERFWEKADRRRLAATLSRRSLRKSATSAVELLAKSPEFLSEYVVVGADVVRRQAKVFQQTTSKIAQLLAWAFGLMTRGLAAAGAVLVSALVYQRVPASHPYLAWIGPRGLERLQRLPAADTLEGALMLIVVLYLAKGAWSLERQFAQKTVSRPDTADV